MDSLKNRIEEEPKAINRTVQLGVVLKKTSNNGLNLARSAKKDEFYTQLKDIEKELKHYKPHFKDKTVFCNCDDPDESNFWRYFEMNFENLGLKKLISTHYHESRPTYKQELFIDEVGERRFIRTDLEQNGDFRSPESVAVLKESDICVTNPPFSLFREFIAQLIELDKQFLVIGSINSVTTKEIFPLIKDKKLWIGQSIRSGDREFRVPDDYPLQAAGYRVDDQGNKYIRVKGVRWFTNMDYPERHKNIELSCKYNDDPSKYPIYENFNAIEVGKVKDIPIDYNGIMGVPITFLDKYSPDQFEIVMLANGNARTNVSFKVLSEVGYRPHPCDKGGVGIINGRRVYARVLIRRNNS
ncbi:TPA: adenine-specific methyltransferase EcoRI family protein [Legionella pneumophila]